MAKVAKSSHKELTKPDGFTETLAPLAEMLERNWKKVVVVVSAAIVAAVLVAISLSVSSRQREQASQAFGQTLADEVKPVIGEGDTKPEPEGKAAPKTEGKAAPASDQKPPIPGEYFSTEIEKQQALLKSSQQVVQKYPNNAGGRTSLLTEGDADYRLGKYPDALQAYASYLERAPENDLLRAYAMVGQAYALAGEGKKDDALSAARSLADHPPAGFGRDLGLLAAGKIAEDSSMLDQARQAYRQLKVDFPDSAAGREASERLTFLGEPPAAAKPAITIGAP